MDEDVWLFEVYCLRSNQQHNHHENFGHDHQPNAMLATNAVLAMKESILSLEIF